MRMIFKMLLPVLAAVSLLGCASGKGYTPSVQYEDTAEQGKVQGIGFESQDLVRMTKAMVADMLANPVLMDSPRPPRVVMDSEYFYNESSSRIDKRMITDRLRAELNKAAAGRIMFVARNYGDMVDSERASKRAGEVDTGTLPMTRTKAGADYRLGGRISTIDAIAPKSGAQSRYHQILFEMVDLETGLIPWSGLYDFKKSAQHDVIYQ